MYIVQSFLHALISAIIIDRAIHSWNINNSLVRQRFRFIVILFPAFSFPLYQLINPDRNSISFRLSSLFDINRWLNMDLWGIIPIGLIFVIILFITTVIFLFQEMIPVLRHTFETKEIDVGMRMPDKISIAHELAHINRTKRPLLITIFLFRVLMFFNPVVLLEFRRIIQDEEKICDDMAVSLTKKPYALFEALQKLYCKVGDKQPFQFKRFSSIKDSLEEYSHNIHIESRIIRLEQGQVNRTGGEWIKFTLVLIVIMIINYFVDSNNYNHSCCIKDY